MGIVYATREQIARSLEINHTARANRFIDEKLQVGSRAVEGALHRRFYPELKTLKFDWPNFFYGPSWELDLGDNEVISVVTLSSGGVVIPSSNFILRRGDNKPEPPFNRIEILTNTTSAFGGGATNQQDITLIALTGHNEDAEVAAQLNANINDTVTTITLDPTSGIYRGGVGSIFKVGTERLIATERRMVDTTQNLGGNIDNLKATVTVGVSNGALFAVDEIILIDAERMRIVDIAGNNLIVERAFDGTVLAAHTAGADVFALRLFTVTRGALGTTAVAHNQNDVLTAQLFPGPINELCVAETTVAMEQNTAAYARVVGSGPSARESAGKGLEDIRNSAIQTYGRKSRSAAI